MLRSLRRLKQTQGHPPAHQSVSRRRNSFMVRWKSRSANRSSAPSTRFGSTRPASGMPRRPVLGRRLGWIASTVRPVPAIRQWLSGASHGVLRTQLRAALGVLCSPSSILPSASRVARKARGLQSSTLAAKPLPDVEVAPYPEMVRQVVTLGISFAPDPDAALRQIGRMRDVINRQVRGTRKFPGSRDLESIERSQQRLMHRLWCPCSRNPLIEVS